MPSESFASALTRTTARLLTVVFAVMVLLFIVTGFLTRAYHREKLERAERQFRAAENLAGRERYRESIEHYAAALQLSRDDPRYKQALALALTRLGRTSEAEAYLTEVARAEPSNGIVNLALARIHSAQGDVGGATELYERAAYGIWPEDPIGNRIRAHFELIDWLAELGENVLVKAELLRLLDEIPEDAEARRRVGSMFLRVGSPEEAQEIFAKLVAADSRDCASQAGLGDAEFDLGNYLSARTAYRNAVRCAPQDLQSRLRLDLSAEIVDLDPMRRGLGIQTRVVRSRRLVERALNGLQSCVGALDDLPEELRDDLEEARIIVERQSQRLRDEVVEQNISLAERLHEARVARCVSPAVPDEALALVLEDLAD